jgi:hypothetical protein
LASILPVRAARRSDVGRSSSTMTSCHVCFSLTIQSNYSVQSSQSKKTSPNFLLLLPVYSLLRECVCWAVAYQL